MSDDESAKVGGVAGIIAALKNVLSNLLAIVQTRLELAATELQEEVGRATAVLLWSFVAVYAAGIGLLLGALVLIFAFWETHRVLVSLLVMGFFFVLSAVALLVLRSRLGNRPRLFEATLAEFERDRQALDRQPPA